MAKLWIRYAAAAALIIGLGAYLWNQYVRPPASPVITEQLTAIQHPAASKHAILTLGDGRQIPLDSVLPGTIASAEGASIVKMSDGSIVYQSRPVHPNNAVIYNTMRTPRGGQYQLTLPDGTKAWLNAASSIHYPTVFNGNERNISVTGEVYLEVAKDKSRPFHIKINDDTKIQVLGTNLNINAYSDEPSIITTLLEGSIKVVKAGQAQLLSPGQQAIITGDIDIVSRAETDKAIAWRNGFFEFRNADLPTVMRQISRWYDVDIVYKNPPARIQLGGIMSRNLPLNDLLRILEGTGLAFTLKGKSLEVYKE